MKSIAQRAKQKGLLHRQDSPSLGACLLFCWKYKEYVKQGGIVMTALGRFLEKGVFSLLGLFQRVVMTIETVTQMSMIFTM